MTNAKRKPAAKGKSGVKKAVRRTGKIVQFLHKPTCTSCRNAREFMEKRGFQLHLRDLWKERLSAAELEQLIGDRDHTEFLNPRSDLYKEKQMKDNPPSRRQAIEMMVEEPGLIRRPVIVAGGRVVVGFDENEMAKF
jgi:Spx/MgsR family transcriptional regulator